MSRESPLSGPLAWIGRHELATLVLALCAAGGAWLFAVIVDLVFSGASSSFDERVLLAMRHPTDRADPVGPGWLEEIGRDFTALGGVGVLTLIALAAVGYLLLDGKRRPAAVVALAILGGLVISTVMKHQFARPRPDLVPHGSIVYTSSFPSGHSMMSALTYLTLGALLAHFQERKRLKSWFLCLALLLTVLVGASRVYLGVHWPTDVLAGWTGGAVWAILCWLLARRLQTGRWSGAARPPS